MRLSLKSGLIIGLLVGIVSAFLYAPKSGKELREELKGKLDIVPTNFFAFLESVVDLLVSVLDFLKVSFQEQREKITHALGSGIIAAKEKSEELKKVASKVISK